MLQASASTTSSATATRTRKCELGIGQIYRKAGGCQTWNVRR